MGRIYTVVGALGWTAPGDLAQINGADQKIVKVLRVSVGDQDVPSPTNQQMGLRFRRLPATVTDGNGSAATPRRCDPGDSAATFTAIVNSTTKATTSGTAEVLWEDSANINTGCDCTFDEPFIIKNATAGVFELLTTPDSGGTINLLCTVWVEEEG